jgi:acetyl esterase/lipase
MKFNRSQTFRLLALAAAAFLHSALGFVAFAQQAPAAPPAEPPKQVPAQGPRILRDLAYVEDGHPRQRLDLYIPAKPAGPLLVWIHGGGWREGGKGNPPALALLAQGVTVASIEYRLSQHALFPAQIEDCKAAIRWLRAHAPEYGYDPKKVAVWGASAGGHLVALLAVTGNVKDFDVGANLDQSSAVQCAIDWFGPADFEAYDPKLPTPMVQRENPDSVIALLFGGPVSQHLELARRASPVTWVTKDAAPILIMQGTNDPLVPLDQSQRLADRLKATGADVTLDVIEGASHGGPQFTTQEKIKLMTEFLEKHWAR